MSCKKTFQQGGSVPAVCNPKPEQFTANSYVIDKKRLEK